MNNIGETHRKLDLPEPEPARTYAKFDFSKPMKIRLIPQLRTYETHFICREPVKPAKKCPFCLEEQEHTDTNNFLEEQEHTDTNKAKLRKLEL